MKTRRIFAALLSMFLVMSFSTSVSASETDTDDPARPVLCEAAYRHLEQDRGLTRDEIDQMLNDMINTRTITTYANDHIYVVSCASYFPAAPNHSFTVQCTYETSDISYWGVVGSYSNHSSTSSGVYTTDTVTGTFNSTGKIFTYRITIANALVDLDTDVSISSSCSGGNLSFSSSFIKLGDVYLDANGNPDGVIDVSDYIALCNFLAESSTPINYTAADVTQNGVIGWSDAYQLEDYIMKRINHIWG